MDEINHLESAIRAGVLEAPIGAVRVRPPYGLTATCGPQCAGWGPETPVAEVVTAWEFADAEAASPVPNA